MLEGMSRVAGGRRGRRRDGRDSSARLSGDTEPPDDSGTILSGHGAALANQGQGRRPRAANGPVSISARRRAARRRDRERGPKPPEERIGELLHNTYRVEKLIATGGMGAVFEVSHTRLEQRFAIKFLDPAFVNDKEAYTRFRREAEIAARNAHDNVVQVFDFNMDDNGYPFMVMELVHGPTLDALLSERGKLRPEEILAIFEKLCPALDACHDGGIVHRDLKPSNISVALDGARTVVKLLDFGISKIKSKNEANNDVTRDNVVMGTPNYMSPEQAQGRNTTLDRRTDIFSLGTILYEMLAGQRAFDADGMPQVLHAIVYEEPKALSRVPAPVAAVVARAMAKAPEKRYQRAGDLYRGLQAAYGMPRRAHQTQSNWGLAALAWVLSIALAVAATYVFFSISQQRSAPVTAPSVAPLAVEQENSGTVVAPRELEPVPSFSEELASGPGVIMLERHGQLYRVDPTGLGYWRDPEATPRRQVLPSPAPVTAIALSVGGSELLVGQTDGTVSRWDRTLDDRIDDRKVASSAVLALAGGSDYLAVALKDTVLLHNAMTGRRIKSFSIPSQPIDLLMTRGSMQLLIVIMPREVQLIEIDRRMFSAKVDLGGRVIRSGIEVDKPDRTPRFWVDFDQRDWTVRRSYSVDRGGDGKLRLTMVSQRRLLENP